MTKRTVVRVLPAKTALKIADRVGWWIKWPGMVLHERLKVDAVRRARVVAKRATPLGQLVIYGRNGRIQIEYTYGKDPKRFKG